MLNSHICRLSHVLFAIQEIATRTAPAKADDSRARPFCPSFLPRARAQRSASLSHLPGRHQFLMATALADEHVLVSGLVEVHVAHDPAREVPQAHTRWSACPRLSGTGFGIPRYVGATGLPTSVHAAGGRVVSASQCPTARGRTARSSGLTAPQSPSGPTTRSSPATPNDPQPWPLAAGVQHSATPHRAQGTPTPQPSVTNVMTEYT